jgi:SsrA-binding protein
MKPVAENRRARFDIAVEQTYEAGISLTSDEIKSIRANRVQLTGAYVRLLHGKGKPLPEVLLIGAHFAQAVDPERSRPLLLKAKEIRELEGELSTKGKTAVPLSIHFKRGWAKILLGVGKGRKTYDKRQLLKERDIEKQQRSVLKQRKA